MTYIAHVRTEIDGTLSTQTAADHCRNAARFAGDCLESIELSHPAYLAGLLHDMGKFKQEFQEYILNSKGYRGSVIHTFAGARYVLETYRKMHSCDETDVAAEIVAYAVAAHHGVFDIENGTRENGFQHRIDNESCCYEESRDAFLSTCASQNEINELMHSASDQIFAAVQKIHTLASKGKKDDHNEAVAFYMGLLARTILSAVIDGDRADTSAFMSDADCKSPNPQADWAGCLERVEEKLNSLPADKPIEIARRTISERCRMYANHPGGILQLNVPTGGGKTLSAVRYALAHAAKYEKARIIYVAPLLTIIEQSASELRDYIQDDGIILEHHSNVINEDAAPDYMADYEALAENWSAPVIITTMVQLLNTMFSSKISSIRRFHNLADCVIVVDEVQTVPLKLLSLFNMALNFLSNLCGATVVLCSATQPCLENVEHSIVATPLEIVPYDSELWSVFKRSEFVNSNACLLDEVPNFAAGVLSETDSLLIVCNKKSEAAKIFEAMRDEGDCFHLSASMCTEHRRAVLKSLRNSLASKNGKTICVSTQVIEAGVDISFGAVIRLSAGMDSVIQSAGRCNRNAESETPAPVYILPIKDEDLRMLGEIKRGKDSTNELLSAYGADPASFDNDLASDVSIGYYYRKLYDGLDKRATEYPVDGDTIYNLLSLNSGYCKEDGQFYYQQAFKTAGDAFKVFDDSSIDVLVPYKEGKKIISEISDMEAQGIYDFDDMKELLDKAKRYTVSIYGYQRNALESQNGLCRLCDGAIAVLDARFYDERTGLKVEGYGLYGGEKFEDKASEHS